MLVEEEVEQIAHKVCSAMVVHGDRGVDDAFVSSDGRTDIGPVGGDDLRHARAEIQQVGLYPQPTAVEALERTKTTCMSRPAKDMRIGAEAIRADHEDNHAPRRPRKPDERGALVGA